MPVAGRRAEGIRISPIFAHISCLLTSHAQLLSPKHTQDQVFCAFDSSNPDQEFTPPAVLEEAVDALGGYIINGLADGDNFPVNQTQMDTWLRDDNDQWNIPSYVVHPSSAGDVVAAVRFAKDHGLEVSVKNSGHVSIPYC